jgi:hypothetical protein
VDWAATVCYSVSKTDPSAKGRRRTWRCVCVGDPDVRQLPCAFHAAREQHDRIRTYLGDAAAPDPNTPLFGTFTGTVVAKSKAVETIEAWRPASASRS